MKDTTTFIFIVILLFVNLLISQCSSSNTSEIQKIETPNYLSDSIGSSSKLDSSILPLNENHWGMKVYKKLLNAVGIPPYSAPRLLQVINGQPIFFDTTGGPKIIIHSNIYKLCEQLGNREKEVALCFLLAHELVHYREHKETFKNCFAAIPSNKKEDEADMLGVFWTFYTGYKKVFNSKIVTNFLDTLYSQPKYPIDSSGIHSPVEVRKKAVSRAIKKSKFFANVFKIGCYFLVIQEYAHAEKCFRHLSPYLYLKEVKTNLGLSQFMLAESGAEVDERYFYPLDLAPNTIYDDRSPSADRDSLLTKAIANLEKAAQMYPQNDFSSLLNLTCAYIANNQTSPAKQILTDIENRKQSNINLARIRVVKAILAKKNGDLVTAKSLFKQAIEKENNIYIKSIVNLNLEEPKDKILNYKPNQNEINDINLGEILMDNNFPLENGQEKKWFSDTKISFKEPSESLLWKQSIQTEEYNSLVLLHIVRKGNSKTAQGIKIGDSINQIIETYKHPTQRTTQKEVSFLFYPNHRLVFKIKKSKVIEWATYEI